MKIGIDISQLAYSNTGVANYLFTLVDNLLQIDDQNEYILFYSNLRIPLPKSKFEKQKYHAKFTIKTFKYPSTVLDFLWNKLHIFPIENFIGDVDIFITSDWTEPPIKKAKKATIIYDMVVFKYPEETAKIIRDVQKRKLKHVQKESDVIFTISQSAKKDIEKILKISSEKVHVIYPGLTL